MIKRKTQNSVTGENHDTSAVSLRPRDGIIIGVIFVLAGILYAISVIGGANHDKNIMDTGVKVRGDVVGVDYSYGKSAREDVTVSYDSKGGITQRTKVTTTNRLGFRNPHFGDEVDVYYDAENPEESVVVGWERKSSDGYWGGAISLVGVLTLVGVFKFTLKQRQAKS